MRAKKSLGQNFLTSKAVARDIVAAADLRAKDTVLEIGPGKGFLTEELLRAAGRVVVVEKDDRLIGLLQEKFTESISMGKLEVVHGDILTFDPKDYGLKAHAYTVVSNIPYYITGHILRTFLESTRQPAKMVLMVQKEVADRIVARDGKESILSISVKAYGTPKYVKKVPARYFSPKPRVDSAILLIDNVSKKHFSNKTNEQRFFEIVKAGFSHKRKMLAKNLGGGKITNTLEHCGIPQKARAEELHIKDWLCLVKTL